MSLQTSEYEGALPSGNSNGTVVVVQAPHHPQTPRRERWLDLPDDYGQAGMRVKFWVNYPRSVQRDLMGGEEATKRALLQIVLEHNGWLDFDGSPYPPANDPGEKCTAEHPEGETCPGMIRDGFWEAITDELAAVLIVMARLEAGKLATSLIPDQRRR
jgi:hypothetical protein